MNGALIVGTTLAGSAVGCVVGVWWGVREDRGSDLPMMFAFAGPIGAVAGALAGCIVGAVLFA